MASLWVTFLRLFRAILWREFLVRDSYFIHMEFFLVRISFIRTEHVIQSEYRKIRTRINSLFGHFSRSDNLIWKSFKSTLQHLCHRLNGVKSWNDSKYLANHCFLVKWRVTWDDFWYCWRFLSLVPELKKDT